MPTLRPRQGSLRFRAKDGQVPDGSSFQKTSWPSKCPKGTCESHSATGASAHRPLNTDVEVACLFSFHFHFYSPAPPFVVGGGLPIHQLAPRGPRLDRHQAPGEGGS